jgi:hypothetical protein
MKKRNELLYTLIFSTFILSGCFGQEQSNMNKKNIIEYKTPEYENFITSANISLEDAWGIVIEEYQKEDTILPGTFYLLMDEKYVFSSHYNKLGIVYFTGYHVDSKTGEVEFIKTSERYQLEYIKLHQGYPE